MLASERVRGRGRVGVGVGVGVRVRVKAEGQHRACHAEPVEGCLVRVRVRDRVYLRVIGSGPGLGVAHRAAVGVGRRGEELQVQRAVQRLAYIGLGSGVGVARGRGRG